MAVETPDGTTAEAELAGLDALELSDIGKRSRLSRIWAATWPKLAAIALVVAGWQLTVLVRTGSPTYVLPGPWAVAQELADQVTTSTFWHAVAHHDAPWPDRLRARDRRGPLRRVSPWRGSGVLRAAIGSLITGLQTMPSIAWFPLAILLFQISERAILFVVVLGAAPSIANGAHRRGRPRPAAAACGRVATSARVDWRCTAT